MKKISILKSLALLSILTLTGVCVTETVLLLKKNQKNSNETKIDISNLTGQMLDREQVSDIVPPTEELLDLLKEVGVRPISGGTAFKLTNIADIRIVTGSIQNNSFQITSVPNSTIYESNKIATIYLNIRAKTQLSSIITSVPDLFLDKYENEDVTKAQILKNLQNIYVGLNINELEVTNIVHKGSNEMNTADIVVKHGSALYLGNASVVYYTSGAAIVTYAKTTLVPGDANVLPTFTFAGVTQTATYTCANVVQPITFNSVNGAFGYDNSVDFDGGLYRIKASYSYGGFNFVAYTNIFAQSNIAIGRLTVTNPTINMTTKNSGAATYTVNGSAPSGGAATYSISPTVTSTKNNEGLTFNTGTGILTWDGTTPTLGGQYVITCTYSGGNNKTSNASASVVVKAQQDAVLTVTNSYIQTGALNSGTLVFTINGQAYTTSATYTTTGLSAGITWNNGNRRVEWDGTTATNGGVVTITASYTLNSQVIKAETKVTIAKSSLVTLGTLSSSYGEFSTPYILKKKDGVVYMSVSWVCSSTTALAAWTNIITIESGYAETTGNFWVANGFPFPTEFTQAQFWGGAIRNACEIGLYARLTFSTSYIPA